MIKSSEKQLNDSQRRPPVVVVLGHVDHGKTSILDFIRKAHIAEKESGGITQHIGAYQINHNDESITFIDTPGHEAFSAMRSRGVKVADIAILVVAADEGIKPQTKEAIKHIQHASLPIIIALNKIDKKEAQPEKVKRELQESGIIAESLGGQTPSINLSAKTGQGIDELLEMIILVAEMEELKNESDKPACGVIIESHLDSLRGPTATLLVRDGILNGNEIIGTDSAYGRIKTMEDFKFQAIEKAVSSTPAIITGFNDAPQIGEKFLIYKTAELAKKRISEKISKRKEDKEIFHITDDKKVLNIILKADTQGSLEAIHESFQTFPSEEVVLRILKSEIGGITESDIKLAQSGQAKIIGFRVKASAQIQQIAQQRDIRILTFEIIYELIQKVRELLSALLPREIIKHSLGQLKVLALFPSKKGRQVIGGKVISGQIKKGALIRIVNSSDVASTRQADDDFNNGVVDENKINKGKLTQLQHNKKDVEEVAKGKECGLMIDGQISIKKGDVLEAYEEERKKREL